MIIFNFTAQRRWLPRPAWNCERIAGAVYWAADVSWLGLQVSVLNRSFAEWITERISPPPDALDQEGPDQ